MVETGLCTIVLFPRPILLRVTSDKMLLHYGVRCVVLLVSCRCCGAAGNTKDVEAAVRSEKEEEEEASNPPRAEPSNSMFLFKPTNP